MLNGEVVDVPKKILYTGGEKTNQSKRNGESVEADVDTDLVIGMACLLAMGGCDDIFEDLEEDIHEDDEYGYYYDEEEDKDSAIINQHDCGTVWSRHPNNLQVSTFCTQAC